MNVMKDRTTVRIERALPASRESVFKALTSRDALLEWWWPWQPIVELDVRPGGAYRLTTVHPQAGSMALRGVYREVVLPSRLVYTWRWEGEQAERETLVTIELIGAEEQTGLSVQQTGFPTESARDDHVRGWTDCLDRLERYLRAGKDAT